MPPTAARAGSRVALARPASGEHAPAPRAIRTLEHFTDRNGSDQTIANAGSAQVPHLGTYGANHMLLVWASGSGQAAQVRDSGNGSTVGSQFTIDVPDHMFHAYKAYDDGSVAYPASGSGSSSIRIARVMPCQ